MAAALARALQRTDRAVLIGSDCPGYHSGYLKAALGALTDHDAVLGPAADGGYVLIGLSRYAPQLFAKMPWGTGKVLAQTRAALERLGWSWAELPTLTDLDRPEDLAQAPAFMASLTPQAHPE
jgi:rSAM/selenodomain-associated transferase 1